MSQGNRQVILEKKESWATVTIHRPEKLNSLTDGIMRELVKYFEKLDSEKRIRSVILTGAGDKAFVAGADVAKMLKMSPPEAKDFALLGRELMDLIEGLSKPVIAAINGYALGGGCELALACDIRIASTNAWLGQPEVGIGIPTGFGGSQRLTKLVGIGAAKELILTGEQVDAHEALRMGLVNKVVDRKELLRECVKVARLIAKRSPIAIQRSKALILHVGKVDSAAWGDMETKSFSESFLTYDQKEGMAAFLERRGPKFKGR